jgi:hypothetical protein
MVQNGQIIRVLIVSASDVDQEKSLIRDAIANWNSTNSFKQATIIEPVAFEGHTGELPEDGCDFMIGAFWTKLPSNGSASSVDTIDQFLSASKPVLLYFSTRPPDWPSIDRAEFDKLAEFKKGIEALGLLIEYSSFAQLRSTVLEHLNTIVNQTEPGAESGSVSVSGPNEEVRQSSLNDLGKFVQKLTATWKSERDSLPISTINARRILVIAARQVMELPLQYLDATTQDSLSQLAADLNHASNEVLGIGREANAAFWTKGDALISEIEACFQKAV